tara:strand:- start:647 stop:1366 length:720 start_codon:yes stop_codon:yes gene_type:complete
LRIKKHENLTKANIAKVIELLEQDKPITKKEACSILNITYNTTRLGKIIDEHKLDIERTSRMKAKLRGKPATDDDVRFVVQRYITGENVSNIASSMYRSPAFVKSIIERIGVPMKLPEGDYEGRRNAMLPDQCVAEEFEVGEVVWAIRKNYPAKIIREITPEHQAANAGYACQGDITKAINYVEKYGSRMYQIYTIESTDLSNTFFPHLRYAGKYCVQLACELGSLKHLEKYGVDLYNI